MAHALQDYRIAWDGGFYRIRSYDDYRLQHMTVKMVGENHQNSQGERL